MPKSPQTKHVVIAIVVIKNNCVMITFEPMLPAHWQEVKSIYEEGIKTGNATFEKTALNGKYGMKHI